MLYKQLSENFFFPFFKSQADAIILYIKTFIIQSKYLKIEWARYTEIYVISLLKIIIIYLHAKYDSYLIRNCWVLQSMLWWRLMAGCVRGMLLKKIRKDTHGPCSCHTNVARRALRWFHPLTWSSITTTSWCTPVSPVLVILKKRKKKIFFIRKNLKTIA